MEKWDRMREGGGYFTHLRSKISEPPEREGEKLERGPGLRRAFDCRYNLYRDWSVNGRPTLGLARR